MASDQSLSGGMRPGQPLGFALWLTGLPASGKSALARELQQRLAQRDLHTLILDSDALRGVLTPQPTYTRAEREWFYSVIVYLAAWLVDNGLNVLIAATGHRRHYRQQARARIERFAEVYVRCPLAVCQARDPKGIYALARAGRADNVPGVGVPYEVPTAPEAAVDTDRLQVDAAGTAILAQLDQNSFFPEERRRRF